MIYNSEPPRTGAYPEFFVNAIFLYDDHYTLILNAGNRVITIDDIPLDDIESALEGADADTTTVSSMVADAPPNKYWTNTYFFSGGFAVKVML